MTEPTTPAPFRKLLVPLDGSPASRQALPYALAVGGDGAVITLLQVIPDAEPLRKPFGQIAMTAEEVRAMLTDLAAKVLDQAIAESGVDAGRFETVVRFGDVTDTILTVADEVGADAVVMATAGRGAIGRLALGSVTDRVVRHSERPVLVVREAEEGAADVHPAIARLVVPLDGSERSRAALPVAAGLAGRLGVAIALISVVEQHAAMVGAASAGGFAFSTETYGTLEDELEVAGREGLARGEAALAGSGARVSTELAHGSAAGAIMDFVGPSDLIVMTSRGQGGVARWLLGSVADKLLRHAPAPVLLVPPAG